VGTGVGVRTPEELRNLVCRIAGLPVALALTRNRVSMVSARFSPNGITLRLNHAFLSAPADVIDALGRYLAVRSREDWKKVAAFASSLEPAGAVNTRLPCLVAKGRVFDLELIRDRINRLHFEGRIDCRIAWARSGRNHRRARTRVIRYGTYNKILNLIRINPLLDDLRVPGDFLDYIVFHEMLHAAVPSANGRGRWRHHHGSFRLLERRYPGYERMKRLAGDLVSVLARW